MGIMKEILIWMICLKGLSMKKKRGIDEDGFDINSNFGYLHGGTLS